MTLLLSPLDSAVAIAFPLDAAAPVSAPPPHVPVLAREVVEILDVGGDDAVVDATAGAGGHASLLLARLGSGGRLLALDRDARAAAHLRETVEHDPRVSVLISRLGRLDEALDRARLARADAILFDLGVSSMQLDDASRGFSFLRDGPLDLRMAPEEGGRTAADLVNRLPEKELADLIYQLGEERASRRVARAIVEARRARRIATTLELAEIVRRAVPFSKADARRIHPATRTFQALRLRVNDELAELERGLDHALERLAPGGRLAVIAFHSLEDRIVKERFRRAAGEGFRVLTKKPMRPSDEESAANPRARSAKLRAVAREEAAS